MFFVTTIDSKDGDMRCVGYFSTLEKAEKAVIENAYDIWETCYDFCVIENVNEGLYQYDFFPIWYKWNDLDDRYEKLKEKPEKYKKIVGFGIG